MAACGNVEGGSDEGHTTGLIPSAINITIDTDS